MYPKSKKYGIIETRKKAEQEKKMKQITFSDMEYGNRKRTTKREVPLRIAIDYGNGTYYNC